jgi:hypothetical protein
MKGKSMVSGALRGVVSALCAAMIIGGCTNSSMRGSEEKTPLQFDYETFVQVPSDCLKLMKDSVEKKFGTDYLYKNAIRSREKPYREAIFSRVEGKSDSTVVVKFDSLCVIKKIYRSLMTFTGEE